MVRDQKTFTNGKLAFYKSWFGQNIIQFTADLLPENEKFVTALQTLLRSY